MLIQLGTTMSDRGIKGSHRSSDYGFPSSIRHLWLIQESNSSYSSTKTKVSDPMLVSQSDYSAGLNMPPMDRPDASGKISCTFPEVLISDSLRTELGNNFFLDTITKDSALHAVSSPPLP